MRCPGPQIITNPRSLNLRCKDGMPLEAVITAGLAHRNIIATLAHFWTSREYARREVTLDGARAVERTAGTGLGLGSGPLLGGAAPADAWGQAGRGAARGRGIGLGFGTEHASPAGTLWDSANHRRRVVDQGAAEVDPSADPGAAGGARADAETEDEMWLVMDYCDRGCLLVRIPPQPCMRAHLARLSVNLSAHVGLRVCGMRILRMLLHMQFLRLLSSMLRE